MKVYDKPGWKCSQEETYAEFVRWRARLPILAQGCWELALRN